MFVYGLSLATPGSVTTSGTANTEVATFTIKAGTTRNAALQAFYSVGRAAGATSISGIAHRCVSFVTASTGGTTVTPCPRDLLAPAAQQACKSGQTVGQTRTNHWVIGHGVAGPGGWVAPNIDSLPLLSAASIASTDLLNVSASTSVTFEWSAESVE